MQPTRPEITRRQSNKSLATRSKISEVATRLFYERGFDAVTMGEIAEAADVTRMTVFNHYARKEEMFFDQDNKFREDLLAVLEHRGKLPALEALRRFSHRAFRDQLPYANFLEASTDKFMETVRKSDALKLRAMAIREELTSFLAEQLARSVGLPEPDATSNLAASLLFATWSVAVTEARRNYDHERNSETARQILFSIVDQGVKGIAASLRGTPYV